MPWLKKYSWLLITLAGAAILAISLGTRQTFGLFLPALTADLGISREAFALAIALQNLLWGVVQPFVGLLSDRFGAGKVIASGSLFYLAGLVTMSQAESTLALNLGAGLLVGLGMSGTGFAVVLGAVGRIVALEQRTVALAIASAGGSFGQFVMIPVGQGLLSGWDWSTALAGLGIVAILMAPLAIAVRNRVGGPEALADISAATPRLALREAFSHRGYKMLTAGFFVCGFHVVFIAVHLPAYLRDLGFPARTGALALTLIGLTNIFGTYCWGHFGGLFRKKHSLALLYALRSLVLLGFILAPKTEFTVIAFAVCMGSLWLGTVPLTSGLVAQLFGARFLSTLFGVVFLGHQLGAFLGAWLGGLVFDLTGSYDRVWLLAFLLSVVATLLHLGITDQRNPSLELQAARL
jgi:predicted MFS family arabinose efflux permease